MDDRVGIARLLRAAKLEHDGDQARQRRRHRQQQDGEGAFVLFLGAPAQPRHVAAPDHAVDQHQIKRDADVPAGEQPRRHPPVARQQGDDRKADDGGAEKPGVQAGDADRQGTQRVERRRCFLLGHAATLTAAPDPEQWDSGRNAGNQAAPSAREASDGLILRHGRVRKTLCHLQRLAARAAAAAVARGRLRRAGAAAVALSDRAALCLRQAGLHRDAVAHG